MFFVYTSSAFAFSKISAPTESPPNKYNKFLLVLKLYPPSWKIVRDVKFLKVNEGSAYLCNFPRPNWVKKCNFMMDFMLKQTKKRTSPIRFFHRCFEEWLGMKILDLCKGPAYQQLDVSGNTRRT